MQETNSRITSDKHCPLRYKKKKGGLRAVGGLSYSDVLESARGWAATILAQQGAEGALRERARGEVERGHVSGHGGLHAGRVRGARRGPLLLVR